MKQNAFNRQEEGEMKQSITLLKRFNIGLVIVALVSVMTGCETNKSDNNGSLLVLMGLVQLQTTPHTVTYDGNGNTTGSVPTDSTTYTAGTTVTVLANTGTLTKTGCTFAGWNTAANGSGTTYAVGQTFAMGHGNVTLFAYWKLNFTQDQKMYNASAVQTNEIITVNTSEADFAATYEQNNFNMLAQSTQGLFFQDSIVKPACIVSVKSSSGIGGDSTWFTNDDSGKSYAVNTFDVSGKISRTDVYSDYTETTRTGYSLYTLNSDGTYQKVLTYNNSDVLQNSLYYTFTNGLVTQIDQWSGDGTGTHLKALAIAYDTSNRVTSFTSQNNSVNNQQVLYVYSGANIQASTTAMYSWGGSSWDLLTTGTHTLNGAGTQINHTSFSPVYIFGAVDWTYTTSGYLQQQNFYSDTAGTTLTFYIVYSYY